MITLVGELAARSSPVGVYQSYATRVDIDLDNKEYSELESQFNVCNIYTMHKMSTRSLDISRA